MRLLPSLFLLALAAPTRAQNAVPDEIKACKELYKNWDAWTTGMSPENAQNRDDAEHRARELWNLEARAGACLERLENDLRAAETDIKKARKAVETLGSDEPDAKKAPKAPPVLVLQQMVDAEFSVATLVTGPSLQRHAIGAPIVLDGSNPIAYVKDAAAVVAKWKVPAARYTPQIDQLVSRLKELAGLATSANTCRTLWATWDAGKWNKKEKSKRISYSVCLQALQNDLVTLETYLRTQTTQPANLKPTDIETWGEPTLKGEAISSQRDVTQDIDAYLVDAYILQNDWKRPVSEATPTLPDVVHSVMQFRGLRDLVSLLLETEVTVQSLGNDGARIDGTNVFESADVETKTSPAVTLSLESDHFFGGDSPFDVSFGGQIGTRPVLTLVTQAPPEDDCSCKDGEDTPTSPAETDSTLTIFPNYQQALVWNLRARGGVAWRRLEASIVGGIGQTFLLDDKTLLDRGKDFVAVRLPGTSRAELFKEVFAEARVYELDQKLIHGENSYLKPTFLFAIGYRWNDRYVPTAGLMDAGISTSDWKKSRFWRFKWNIRNSFVSRSKYDKPTLVTFTFGVERESWRGDLGLPTNTTFTFSGVFDLAKIISKSK